MRFLADENFPGAGVKALRASGADVGWVRTEAPGLSDQEVLAWAIRDGRILLTFDKDFGELALRSGLPPECGVVLFRISLPEPSKIGARLAAIITTRDDWAGSFSVVEPGRVRMRRLRDTPQT
jgi:hypothetical protein